MEVIADVRSVPVGSTFELGVEATYWNAFSGGSGDDYTTYSHADVDSEMVSVTLLAPGQKPFRGMMVSETIGDQGVGHAVDGLQRTWGVPGETAFHWSTTTTVANAAYKVAWEW